MSLLGQTSPFQGKGWKVRNRRNLVTLMRHGDERLEIQPVGPPRVEDKCKDEFRRALRILHRLETTEQETHALLSQAGDYFRGRRPDLSQQDLLRRLSLEQVDLSLELHEARTAQATPKVRAFREALLTRWGVADWLESISGDVERIKDVLHNRTELVHSTHIAWFAAAALPLLLTVPLAAFFVEKLHGWKDLASFIGGLALVNVALFWACLKFTAWLDRRPPRPAAR